MKRCPYCAEEVQEEAVKCRYCGEFLNKKKRWLNCFLGCLLGFFGLIILVNIFAILAFILLKAIFYKAFFQPMNLYGPAVPDAGLNGIWRELIEGTRVFWERITL